MPEANNDKNEDKNLSFVAANSSANESTNAADEQRSAAASTVTSPVTAGVVNVVSGSQDASSSTRRRRAGRRVVRVAGAAGESMKLHVQGGNDYDTRSEETESESVVEHQTPVRPITSLLFQEPVLPHRLPENNSRMRDLDYDDDANESDRENSRDDLDKDNSRSSRKLRKTRSGRNDRKNRNEDEDLSRVRSRKNRNNRNNFDDNYDSESDDDTRVIRVRSRVNRADRTDRSNRANPEDLNEIDNRSDSRISRNNRDYLDKDSLDKSNFDKANLDKDNGDKYSENNNNGRKNRDNQDNYDDQNHRKSRKNRRLNAAERRAAAEVEQIEEDLEYDDIVYSPIDDVIDERIENSVESDNDVDSESTRKYTKTSDLENNDDEDGEMITRRRRRRRPSRADKEDRTDRADKSDRSSRRTTSDLSSDDSSYADDYDINEIEVSQEDRDLIPDPDELRSQDDEEVYTRRRRRRRSKSSDDSSQSSSSSQSSQNSQSTQSRFVSIDSDSSSRRSRKQQYIDEITDIEGSTRLEAKKQRRRDNRRERNRQNLLMEQDFLARRENVDRLMVVRERDRHTQISVIEDNILVEHYVSDIQEVATVGNIYLGRVQNVLPSMEAAFVDIGQARNGVLYAGEVNWDTTRLEGQPRRMELAFKAGDPVLVQVTKDPIGHKGARLTSQVTLAGRFLVLVPSGAMTGVSRKLSDRERSRLRAIVSKIAPKDMGIIIRTAADGASEDAIEKDLESLVKQWERIEEKREEFLHGKRPKLLQGEPDVAIRVVRDIFNDDFQKMIVEGKGAYDRICEYLEMMAPDLRSKIEYWDPAEHEGKDVFDKWQIDSQLRKGMERQVYLPAGGSIVIDRTEAMTTIDVNTGRFIGRGKSLEETVTRCNLEASEEIARQLRLRDIGGMVMIDYVDMVMPANRDLVLRRLVECLARDRTKHQVAEVTSLGLVQMTRKRVGQGLVEAFSEECPTCKGRGFILHDEPTVSSEYADPYALKGGDPFIKTNKHGHGSIADPMPVVKQESSADVRAKLARIAAAAASSAFLEESLRKSDEKDGNDNKDDNNNDVNAVAADDVANNGDAGDSVVDSVDSVDESSVAGDFSAVDASNESAESSEESQVVGKIEESDDSQESQESTESSQESSEN
ncbi:Rne/Rng family ribonuclease [Gardnerella vaginalis]|uniref:Rne/Rng family ribonuclease n=1 Tax=Gardnerella vaginalis TaxID=2702 RepID=UPI0016015962|nr:Rne/Rng family ribonuclease [Gardnerella vaginalis]